jgi:glycosyltransferase involved in cell wall biosynthesis
MLDTPITACILALNDEPSIADCLDSLGSCNEIVVIDAHSKDRTREIAAARGARVIEREWLGYQAQRQFAVRQASNNWVLSIDANEQMSPGLASELLSIRPHRLGQYAGYRIPVHSNYFGLPLGHGDWQPTHHLRLFDRRRAAIRGDEIRETIAVFGPVGRLRGEVRHNTYRDLDHQLGRLGGYARIMSDEMHARGKHASALRLFLDPAWRFLQAYVFKQGFLDGWRGFAMAQIEANYVWEQYLRLYIAERAPREMFPIGDGFDPDPPSNASIRDVSPDRESTGV